MLANISSMRYVQTSNVREDVSKLISQYDRYDAEMSNSQKQPLSQKKKFFAKLLARVPLISHAIMQHQLHHFASTWDVFRSTVLRACQTVMEMEGTIATNSRNNSLYGHNNRKQFREDVYLAWVQIKYEILSRNLRASIQGLVLLILHLDRDPQKPISLAILQWS